MSGFRYRLLAVAAPLALALIASPALAQGCPWHLDAIDERSPYWDNRYFPCNKGLGYTIWVIGTGIDDTHPEFGDRAQQVANFAGGPNEDTIGHGTWVASLAGGATYGVAPHTQLRGVKVIDGCGQTNPDWIISGIEYVQANADGSSVAVFPFAFETNPEIDRAIINLVSSGVPVAVAAGDEPIDACDLSPARASQEWGVTTVGALDISWERPSWSAYGGCIEIYAPGESITAAWPSVDGTRPVECEVCEGCMDILAPGEGVASWQPSADGTMTLDSTGGAAALVAGALTLYKKRSNVLLRNATPPWRYLYVGHCPLW